GGVPTVERWGRARGRRAVSWIDAGRAVFLIAGSAAELEAVGQDLRSIPPDAVDHLDLMAATERRYRSLDTALAWTAHEFRTPLMSVHARLQSLLNNGLSEEVAVLLSRSSEELTDLGNLVES